METTLFTYNGYPVAYLANDYENSIYLWNGIPIAYLDDNKVYGYNGNHLGWYEAGIMYDTLGFRVGFTKETCPMVTSVEPVKWMKSVTPVKSVKSVSNIKPVFGFLNSELSFESFLSYGYKL